jgi:hypothetical protein
VTVPPPEVAMLTSTDDPIAPLSIVGRSLMYRIIVAAAAIIGKLPAPEAAIRVYDPRT